MFVGEGDQAEVVWECINISDENVENIAKRTDEILRQGKSAKRVKKFAPSSRHNQVKYLTRSRLRVPEISTKNKSILDCPNNCGSSFFHKHALDKHLKFICGQPLRYKCPYCDMSSRIRNNLNNHIIARHPDCKNYVIDTCIGKTEPLFEQDFNSSHTLHVEPTWNEEREIKILSVSSLAKPEDIKPEFSDFKDESIIKSPSRKKKFVCPNNCGNSYKHEYTLKVHMEFACGKLNSEGNLSTDQHNNSFHLDDDESDSEGYDDSVMEVLKAENPDELLNPMAIGEIRKTVDGKWLCPNKCGSAFSSRGNLNYHLRTNCGREPKFECPYCLHRVKQPSNGFIHVKNHHPGSEICLVNIDTGEVIKRKKDFGNDEKMNISNATPEVSATSRSSSDKVETTCHSCGKEFKFGYTLSRHLAEGCGFPPRFKCPYCEYQVRRLSYAFFHITKNHPGCEVYMVDLITGDSITDPAQIKKEAIEDIVKEEKPLAPNPAFVSRSKKVLKTRPGGLQKKKLMCPKGCGHYFFFRLSLQKHMKYCKRKSKVLLKTVDSTRFKCPYCTRCYGYRSSIFRHIKARHPRHKKYAIDTHEEEIMPENAGSQVHTQEKKTKKEIPKAKNMLLKIEKLSNDSDPKTEDGSTSAEVPKMFACPNKCGSTFEHSFNVNRHIRDNCAKVRRFKCPQCSYRSNQFRLIGKHIKTSHRMSKVYAIDFFTKKLVYSEPIRRPRSVAVVKKEQANVKPAVDEKLESTTTPKNKTTARKSRVQKRFPCPNNCGSTFSLERYIETHLRLICGKAPRFKCPYCPQICRHQGNITEHIKHRHPGKRNYMIDTLKKKSNKIPRKQKTTSEVPQEDVAREELPNQAESNDVDNQNITEEKTSADVPQPRFRSNPAKRKIPKTFNSRKRRLECHHKCGRYFQSLTKLKMHEKSICKKAPIFKCPYCTKVCKHSWNFDMHLKHRHPEHFDSNSQTQQIESEEPLQNDNDLKEQNLDVADEIEEMEDNHETEDIEMEDANEVEDPEVECAENEDDEIQNESESNTTNNLNTSTSLKKFPCTNNCGSSYTNYCSLKSHLRYTCQKTPRFKCPYCDNCTKQTSNGYVHVKKMHRGRQIYLIDIETNKFVCGSRYQPPKGIPEVPVNEDLEQENVGQIQNIVANQDAVVNEDALRIEDLEAMDDSNDEPDEPDEPILGIEEEFGASGPAASQKSSTEKIKPFICPNNCGSSFSHEYRLTNHVRDQCGPPRYKCPYCFYITRQPSNVYTHIKNKHPDERIYMIDTDMNQSCDEPGSPPGDDEN